MAYKNPLDERAKIARRKHYQKNKEQYYKNNLIKKEKMRAFCNAKKDVPCSDCGIKYPSFVMEFDHINRETKRGKVSDFVSSGNWKKLNDEIIKCEVVCANCHRIRTAKQLGFH